MVHRTQYTGEVHHLGVLSVHVSHLMTLTVEMIERDHRRILLTGRQSEEMMTDTLCTNLRHEQTGLLRKRFFGVHRIGGEIKHLFHKTLFLIPCNRFLAFSTGLDIHTAFREERVLTIVVCLTLGGSGMTVFHCRVRITETGFPVLTAGHIVIESRTEQLCPVDTLFPLGKIELDIIRFRQLVKALLDAVLIRMLPAFVILPKRMTNLEILRVHLFLQGRQLLQLRRVKHLHVVLVKGGVIEVIVLLKQTIGLTLFSAVHFLEVRCLTELQKIAEEGICQSLPVTSDFLGSGQTLVIQHLTTFGRVFVFAGYKFLFTLLKIATLNAFF